MKIDLKKLKNQIDEYCVNNKIFGVVRVTVKDDIVFEQSMGYADLENKIPFSKDSMFTFYSLSKPFCVLGLLKLYDKVIIDIDKHPSVYLPEAEGLHEKVTIRHMLYHISGLPDFEQDKSFCDSHLPGFPHKIREHLKELKNYKQNFEPATAAMYANVNMIIPALIIENVTGISYEDYMKKEVFEPLGMKTAVIDNENRYIENRTKCYDLIDGEICEIQKSHNWLLGAGDIVGTVDDVYCLNKAIKHKLLVSEKTWNEILTPSPLNSMGMGCTVIEWYGKLRVNHNGGHLGFRTIHIQVPKDDFDIIFLSNTGYGSSREDICDMIHNAFYGTENQTNIKIEMDKGYI